MRLYYIDESEGPRYYVRSALGVDAERWNDLFHDIHEWRQELRESRGIPTDRELHACDLLAGRGLLVRNDKGRRAAHEAPGSRSLPGRAAPHGGRGYPRGWHRGHQRVSLQARREGV